MIRIATEEVLLFLLPFAGFALFLLLMRRNVLGLAHWSRGAGWLVIAGLLLVIGTTVIGSLVADRHVGAYVPPHLENGRAVPGAFR